MTCIDCIHYDVCVSRITYDENFGDTNSLNHNCDEFQDKSKFIELPDDYPRKVYIKYKGERYFPYSLIKSAEHIEKWVEAEAKLKELNR